jgi:hypothetical protein
MPVDPRLTQNASQEFHAYISLMRIRNSNGDVAADHELVFATRIWTLKSKRFEMTD